MRSFVVGETRLALGALDARFDSLLGLFRRGIFLNPMGTKLYLSLAHDEAVCDELLDRLADALDAEKTAAP